MNDITQDAARHAETTKNLEDMGGFGIPRVPEDWFQFREFRYTNLKDVIAKAKRQDARDQEGHD